MNHGTSLVKPGRIRYRAYSLQIGVQLELQGTYSIGQHRETEKTRARILITQLTGRARLNFILENSLAHPSPTGSARATRLDKERCHEPACPCSCPGPCPCPGGPTRALSSAISAAVSAAASSEHVSERAPARGGSSPERASTVQTDRRHH